MKTKGRHHAEHREIPNKPGRFVVIRQWSENGILLTDDAKGEGYTESEAIKLCVQHNQLNNISKPACRRCR